MLFQNLFDVFTRVKQSLKIFNKLWMPLQLLNAMICGELAVCVLVHVNIGTVEKMKSLFYESVTKTLGV